MRSRANSRMTEGQYVSLNQSVRIAIDIGGTFTDFQVLGEGTGICYAHKTPTTPDDPSEGLLLGLREAAKRIGFSLGQVSAIIHGTTIATNAVLQRKLPRAALITTSGFEDVLEIGRHFRRRIYSNKAEPRTLLIPRSRRFGIKERIKADGSVECELDSAEVARLATRLTNCNAETVAVALLHAYANRDHERLVAEILERYLPNIPVSISSEISPEFREYERTSTTVLNALLMPVVGSYLHSLEEKLAKEGVSAPVFLVQSNGGVTTPNGAARQPARLLLSGPSGGAKAAETIAERLAILDLVAVDMGGTSYDVSLVENGRVRLINQGEVDSCPVRLPMVEMRTIGAGGGSIAKVDTNEGLKVGPESAGANPGPVCYGNQEGSPTVTDANVILGRIDPDIFLSGAMVLDAQAAYRSVANQIAERLSLGVEEAAEGIIKIAVAHMASAIRLSLFEKGFDPKDFTLISFGGAGGLHACETASELGIKRVIFPSYSATLSAWGMLYADIAHDLTRAKLMKADSTAHEQLAKIVVDLRKKGEALLRSENIDPISQKFEFSLDLRYPGQAYEIGTPFIDSDDLCNAVNTFHNIHFAQYAHKDTSITPEIINIRLKAVGLLEKPGQNKTLSGDGGKAGQRRIFVGGAWCYVPIYDRATIKLDKMLIGPMVIEEPHSTIFISNNWSVQKVETGELVASMIEGSRNESDTG